MSWNPPPERNPDRDQETARFVETVWRKAPVPEPSREQWDRVGNAIAEKIEPPRSHPARRGALLSSLWVAAATLLFAALGVGWWRAIDEQPSAPGAPQPVEPFPIALAEEVEIQSMDASDAHLVVVGEVPITDSLVPVAQHEVVVDHMEPNEEDGMMPDLYRTDEGITMLIMPMGEN